jgi:hypothetical protein
MIARTMSSSWCASMLGVAPSPIHVSMFVSRVSESDRYTKGFGLPNAPDRANQAAPVSGLVEEVPSSSCPILEESSRPSEQQ